MKIILLLGLIISLANCAISADKVTGLTDISSVYTEDFYSGTLELDDDIDIHYWFFPVTQQATEPLLIWLNSGPGCSGLYDAVYGNGPFVFNTDSSAQTFKANDETWQINSNILYIDAPGVGYSTGPSQEYDDNQVVRIFHKAVVKFLKGFNEYLYTDILIGGKGYAGVYAPKLALLMIEINETPGTPSEEFLQIRGVITGNAMVSKQQIPKYTKKVPYYEVFFLLHQGILNWDMVDEYTANCGTNPDSVEQKTDKCDGTIKKISGHIFGLNRKDINADCVYKNLEGDEYDCTDDDHVEAWFNTLDVKTKLHVKDTEVTWKVCSTNYNYKQGNGSITSYPSIMKKGIKVWTYSGDSDATVPFKSTLAWIDTIREDQGLSDIVSYTSWYFKHNATGYVQNGGSYWLMDRLTFLRFKGCGMDVLSCNREGSRLMFKKFIYNHEMPLDAFNYDE